MQEAKLSNIVVVAEPGDNVDPNLVTLV